MDATSLMTNTTKTGTLPVWWVLLLIALVTGACAAYTLLMASGFLGG